MVIKWWLPTSLYLIFLNISAFLAISFRVLENMLLLVFLTLGLVVGSHEALSPELYWKSMLPNTVMPKAIRDFKEVQAISILEVKSSKWMEDDIGLASNRDYGVYKPPSAASSNQNQNQISMYFFEKDIHTGSIMTLDFTTNPTNGNGPPFLPRKVSDSIPFSSSQFPQILARFAIKPESKEANAMKNTIARCERPAIQGEDKHCATSLESMVDFIASKVGKLNVAAVSSEGRADEIQNYRIANGLVKLGSDNVVVVCHKEKYPYGVFYCHALVKTNAYVVPLVGSDGTKVDAVAICHVDTSEWSPNHLAFQMLKVKPGTSSICHFLGSQQFVFFSKN